MFEFGPSTLHSQARLAHRESENLNGTTRDLLGTLKTLIWGNECGERSYNTTMRHKDCGFRLLESRESDKILLLLIKNKDHSLYTLRSKSFRADFLKIEAT